MLIQNVMSYENFENYLKEYKYVIVNISAIWCKPCIALKPHIEKFVNVIDDSEIIYLKIDYSIYEEESEFNNFFHLKKIPYFSLIKNGIITESFVNGDFDFVSKKIFNFITSKKGEDKLTYNDFNKNEDF